MMYLKEKIFDYKNDEEGVVTADFVAITAAVIILGSGALTVIINGTASGSAVIGDGLTAMEVPTE